MIITVIAFLIAYKLVDYIADFKTVKKHSRIDIIFLTIFFAMLFIPMAHIDDGIVSTREDRVLAKWKPLFLKDGKINLNFGNDFNKWFNDRFNLRPHLIFLYAQTNFLIKQNYVSLTITDIYKTSDYFFDKKNTAYEHNSQDIEIFSKNINKLHKFCNNNGIKLYVIIVPSKVSFYQKYDLKFKKLLPDKTNELQKNLKEKYNIEIIYPEKEFKKYEDKDFIYFKPDHHMTDFGQYILYSLLINKMQQDFPMLSATPLSDFKIYKSKQIRWNWDRKFHNGQMYHKSMLNYPKLLKDSYTYYDYKYPEKIKIIGEGTHITHINNNGNYKLLIVGDSFSENLVYFLNTNFSHIERYRHNMKTKEIIKKYDLEMKPYEKIMKDLKPDALVIIRHSGMLKEFKDMYPKEER